MVESSYTVCYIKKIEVVRAKTIEMCDFCGKNFAKWVIRVIRECYLVDRKGNLKPYATHFLKPVVICEDCMKKLIKGLEERRTIEF